MERNSIGPNGSAICVFLGMSLTSPSHFVGQVRSMFCKFELDLGLKVPNLIFLGFMKFEPNLKT